jgi:hypothetical protein
VRRRTSADKRNSVWSRNSKKAGTRVARKPPSSVMVKTTTPVTADAYAESLARSLFSEAESRWLKLTRLYPAQETPPRTLMANTAAWLVRAK